MIKKVYKYNSNKKEIIITYDLKEGEDYEKFKNEVYTYFNYKQKEKDRIPNTTIVLELNTNKKVDELFDEIINEFGKEYTIKKLLVIESKDSILKKN